MTAAAVSGLFIAEDSANFNAVGSAPSAPTAWGGSVDWQVDIDGMAPASTAMNAVFPSFFTATSNKEDGTVSTDTIKSANRNVEYIAQKIWIKTEDTEAKALNCQVSITAPEGSANRGYERVAIINATGNPSNVVLNGASQNCWVLSPNADSANGLSSTAGDVIAVPAIADDSPITVATNFSNAEAQCFYVYVWFEGQDTDCKNANSGAGLSVSLNFSTPNA